MAKRPAWIQDVCKQDGERLALVVRVRMGISRFWGARHVCGATLSTRGFQLDFSACAPIKNGHKVFLEVPYASFCPGMEGHLTVCGEVKWYDDPNKKAGGQWCFANTFEGIVLGALLEPLVQEEKKEEDGGFVRGEAPLKKAS